MDTERCVVGVVIPYYQRDRGILARALRSVAAQRGVGAVRVVVVDDESPVPAESEIADLGGDFPFDLQVIHQRNAGPGAARNRAIVELGDDVRFIAFLDSDDEWRADHLERALAALSNDFDVFFSDFRHPGVAFTSFRRAERIDTEVHPTVAGIPGLHAYHGDMLAQILTGNIIGTPTVVYNRHRFPQVAFRTSYRNAGEDYLFWIDLVRAGARFAFSTECEVVCGFGVNVYAGAGWGTETHFLRLHNEIKYRKAVSKEFPLSNEVSAKVKADVTRLRYAIARDLLHRVIHRKTLPLSWAKDHVRTDPWTFVTLPWVILSVAGRRISAIVIPPPAVGREPNSTLDG
jgi:succinoglycan biosynthesis protein ExoW